MGIWEEAQELQNELVERRRDLHRHPETGFTEFRTGSIIVKELKSLGYDVVFGSDAFDEQSMMGVPSKEALEKAQKRAIEEGADPKLVELMSGGKTGAVGILRTGKPGNTVAFRFDMDCNDVAENQSSEHRPTAEGFASKHANEMHACGHDGHVSIGLSFAKLLVRHKDDLAGTIKLIFQPAEEGVRGAFAMVNAGVVDDVDYLFGGHIASKVTRNNVLAASTSDTLATSKVDVVFRGVAAHAGVAPEQGKNALLAAAQSAVSLSGITRHSKGASRINIGVLRAGTGRNVIPNIATMKFETRGDNNEINEFMLNEALRILRACADIYDVEMETKMAGGAPSCVVDSQLAQEVKKVIGQTCHYDDILDCVQAGGSEDCSYFMQRVQQRGGQAIYMMYGSEIAAGHHNISFDFNEDAMWKAVATLTEIALHFSKK